MQHGRNLSGAPAYEPMCMCLCIYIYMTNDNFKSCVLSKRLAIETPQHSNPSRDVRPTYQAVRTRCAAHIFPSDCEITARVLPSEAWVVVASKQPASKVAKALVTPRAPSSNAYESEILLCKIRDAARGLHACAPPSHPQSPQRALGPGL